MNTENNNQKESSFGYHTGSKGSTPSIKNEYSKERGQSLKLIIRGQLVRKFELYQSHNVLFKICCVPCGFWYEFQCNGTNSLSKIDVLITNRYGHYTVVVNKYTHKLNRSQ